MPDYSTSQSIQRLAFEGPISLFALIPLAILIVGLTVWLAKADFRNANRSRWIPVFLFLRVIALAALFWMLAGPTLIQTLTNKSTKSIAILVDQSASMKLVDPVDESGSNLRWLQSESSQLKPLRQLDMDLGRLSAISLQIRQLAQSPTKNPDSSQLETHLAELEQTREATTESLREIANSLPSELTHQSDTLRELIDEIDGSPLHPSELLADQTQTMQDLADRLHSSVQRLGQLGDRMAESLETAPATELSEALGNASVLSRSDKVRQRLKEAENSWLGKLEETVSINRYQFGDRVTPTTFVADPTDSGEPTLAGSTDLGEALQQIALDAADQQLEAAVVFTDGGHNSGTDPLEVAGHLSDVPLFVVPIGNTKMPRDVILHHTLGPRAVYQNDRVVVDSMVTAYRCSGEKLQVELLADGAAVDQQIIDIRREIFDARVQLKWKATELGKHHFQVRATPLSDEKSIDNNDSELSIHVMEDKIRVLIADNMPRWEFRYLVNLFDRDDRVEYEQLIFEPRHSASGRTPSPPTFPYDYDQWMRYRIVILGDVRPSQLSLDHQQLLHRYVTEFGGNLIVVAGRESMPVSFMNQPLETLLPVQPGDRPIDRRTPYTLSVTPEGALTMPVQLDTTPVASETLWQEMSRRLPIYSLSDFSQLKPTGHSLLAAAPVNARSQRTSPETRSFLSWQYVGRGRVVYLAAPISYQLRYRQGDKHHHRFWGQLLRWAIARDLAEGSRTVRLATDKTRYEQGESVRVTGTLYRLDGSVVSGAAPVATISQGDDTIRQIELEENVARPGTYEGTLNALPTGKIKVSLGGDPIPSLLAAERYDGTIETTINIDPNGSLEFRHPLCNLPLLNQVARTGNGIIVPPTALAATMDQFNLEPKVTESVRRHPIWNQWKYLWLFVGCLSLEWLGRKLIGLV